MKKLSNRPGIDLIILVLARMKTVPATTSVGLLPMLMDNHCLFAVSHPDSGSLVPPLLAVQRKLYFLPI